MNQKKTQQQSHLDGAAGGSGQPQRQEHVASTDKKADGHAKTKRLWRPEDLIGKRFGRLTIESVILDRRSRVVCKCDCGKMTTPFYGDLIRAKYPTKSCGCFARDNYGKQNIIHGMSSGGFKRSILGIHSTMLQRCYDKNCRGYKRYGGRGITVCDRWRFGEGKLGGLQCFMIDMGDRPTGFTIERKNNNLGYSKANCAWATYREQANNRSSNVVVEFNGKKQTAAQWSREFGIGFSTLRKRLGEYRWSVHDALTIPVQTKNKK